MSATATLAHEQNIRLAPAHGKLRVLLVEDNPSDIELVSRELRRGGFDLTFEVAQTEQEFVERVRSNSYQVVLADYNLPQWRGMEAVNVLRKENLDIPVILVSGALGDVTAVECIKQGAGDYVLKDRPARPMAVLSALQEKRLRDERQHAMDDLAKKVDELARSNRELEQFAYVASHDLQEPLRMVAAYTQLLAERYKGKLDEPADKYIHYAVDGAKRMQTLIQDLLAFSRVGRLNTEVKDTDCNVAVEIAIANLQSAIRESDTRITHDHLPVVLANPTQLAQVFQNLIGNAIKFRGPKAPQIQITVEKQADEWLFSVADNGIGIAPEYCQDIFVIFKRLHTRAEYPGNGIGLAICRKIIEQYGGRIWVTSQEGVGSTFRFTLPVSEAGSSQRQNRDDHCEILLVDDNPADLDLTAEMLSRGEFCGQVRTVNDGAEAIAFLHRQGKYAGAHLPDLILLDLNLPKKDGRAVLAHVKNDPTLRKTPVVVFSTSQAARDILGSYELGANSYVTKPGDLQEFALAVKSIQDFWFRCARLPQEEKQL